MPLFAGWRAGLHSVDGAGRRRCDWRLRCRPPASTAVVPPRAVPAAGVPPLNAVISGRNGADERRVLRLAEAVARAATTRDAMGAVEEVTDAMVAPAFEALTDDERAELAQGCARCSSEQARHPAPAAERVRGVDLGPRDSVVLAVQSRVDGLPW